MLNDLFRDKLQAIASDELLIKAIREVFEETVEKEKPIVEKADFRALINNELLGEKYRAYDMAKQIIEQGFIDLMSYKVGQKPIKNFNKER